MSAAELFYHRFGMKRRGPGRANARSGRRVLEGFLIRVDGGYGCVQPWPELGDATLEEQWQALRSGGTTPLLVRARECAAADAAARREGQSLFAGLTVPPSHATVTGGANFAALRAEGFEVVKLKGGRDWKQGVAQIRAAVAAGLRVRADFNGVLTEREFVDFARAAADVREGVDFVEDPVPYEPEVWERLRQETGWKLALDRAERAAAGGFDLRVLKPAADAMLPQQGPVVITSYMDHPVGQVFAAWEAARYAGTQGHAGLLTHHLFEPDAFTARLAVAGPDWVSPGGTGLGFDDLLEALPWVPLQHPLPRGPGRVWQNPRDPLPDGGPLLEAGQVGFATSGSTGVPSVVVHSVESLEVSAAAVNAWLGARAEDVWLRVLPEFHVGGFQIHTRAGLSGGRVVVDREKWEPGRFARICREEAVTLTSLVPAQVADVVQRGARGHPPLRAVVVGGGAMDESLRQQALALGWPVLPSYGASEAASQVATAPLGGTGPMELLPLWEARTGAEAGSPGGFPGPGGAEAAGLLELRGPALASGRFVREKDAWILHPLTDQSGWWRSADRVVLSGRELHFAGRADRVVKVLGELVHLEEVERSLAAAGLERGRFVVVAVPAARRGMELVVVLEASHGPEETALAAYRAGAAPFARVGRVVRVAALPRSPIGKVRYAELAERIPPAVP